LMRSVPSIRAACAMTSSRGSCLPGSAFAVPLFPA
jgi:hypothetical protein